MTKTEDVLIAVLIRPEADKLACRGFDSMLPANDGNSSATDGQIIDRAYFALRASGYGQLQRLQVYCDHGRVTLQGRLPTYYLKQVAQSVVLTVAGVLDIDNDVKVECHS